MRFICALCSLALLASAVSAQVVIRERVELAPPPATDSSASKAENVVAPGDLRIAYHAWYGPTAASWGAPLSGTVGVRTLLNNANEGELEGGFAVQGQTGEYPYEHFSYLDFGEPGPELVSITVGPYEVLKGAYYNAARDSIALFTPGSTSKTFDHYDVTVGCSVFDPPCVELYAGQIINARFGLRLQIDGMGEGVVVEDPGPVMCGTEVRIVPRAVRSDGLLGWANPTWPTTSKLFAPDGGTLRNERFQSGKTIGSWYLIGGDVWYQAPPCAELRVPSTELVEVEVDYVGSGSRTLSLLPPPPESLAVVIPDTVDAGELFWVSAIAQASDGVETYLEPSTPSSLSSSGPVQFLGAAGWSDALSLTYDAGPNRLRTGVQAAVIAAETTACGATVPITATAGDLSGVGTVVVRETSSQPDTLLVSPSAPTVAPGATVTIHADAGCGAPSPDETVRVLLSDPDAGQLVYDSPEGLVQGDVLDVRLDELSEGRLAFQAAVGYDLACSEVWVGALGEGRTGAASVQIRGRGPEAPPDPGARAAWPACGASPSTVDLLALQLAYALEDDNMALLDVPCEFVPGWADVGSHEAPQVVIDRLEELEANDRTWARFFGDWSIQELVDARGPRVNMDYYAVRIDLPAGADEVAFFEGVRIDLNDYLDQQVASFEVYPGDEIRWEVGPVVGTVGVFQIKPGPGVEDAGVIASAYWNVEAHAGWRFSTLWASGLALGHPVSGTREFGIYQETTESFVVYTRGVDRVEGFASTLYNTVTSIGDGDGDVFDGGDDLWRSFQSWVSLNVAVVGGQSEEFAPLAFRPDWDRVRGYFEQSLSLSELLNSLGCGP